jgi:hypothetical protein
MKTLNESTNSKQKQKNRTHNKIENKKKKQRGRKTNFPQNIGS